MRQGVRRHLTVTACLALLSALATARAQTTPTFRIPAQPLESALIAFAQAAGVELGYDSSTTDEPQSRGLNGSFTVEEGLSRLLAGTGKTWTRIDRDAYRVHDETGRPTRTEPPEQAGAPAATATAATAEEIPPLRLDEIVAVGTRIRESGFGALQPVTVIDSSFIGEAGAFSASDLFDFVPLAGINSFNGIDNYFYGINDARGDVATANLRGLGGGNSLLLLNGRRVVNHPATQAENGVIATTANLNALPLFAIDHIDILHDGASSIYGSDAVAGVVNAVINSDRRRMRVGLLQGLTEDGKLARTAANFQVSTPVGKSARIALFAEFSDQDGLEAGDRSFSASSDFRPLFENTAFAGDSDLDNRSRSSAWGQFVLPQDVLQNGQPVTSDNGVLHIQPSSFPGCTAALGEALCIDDGVLDRGLRFNSNAYRYLAPSIDRINLFSMWSASLSDNTELYGEIGWFRSSSRHKREPANPLTSHPITIPRDNYWNPFGPLAFDDGRPNPNRLTGINAPPEGLPVSISTRALGGFYKVVDAGPRIIDVENRVDRVLIGARAWLDEWSIDTAYLYSTAATDDVTYNRISSTLFQDALSLTTPDAYNPFNGGDPANPGSGDATPNPQPVIDSFLIDVRRANDASLELWDFVLSNPSAASIDGRPLGVSFGGEVRRESFSEKRDPRLNGEIGYTDRVTGISYASDVMQSSITPDTRGSRTVRSLFGEFALALVDESMAVPLVRRLDANAAVRLESYSDVGTEWRPRLGIAWWLDDHLGLHASWSRGLRAPNLAQVNPTPVPRIQIVRDWYRCQALVNKGVYESLGACDIEAARTVEVTTFGSDDLMVETNSSLSIGLRYQASADGGLVLSADYWEIDQRDVVGIFGEDNHVALDYFLRLDGGANPAVTRAPATPEDLVLFEGSGLEPVGLMERISDPYLNLDRRLTRGIDLALALQGDAGRLGLLDVDLQATRLLEASQSVPESGQPIVDAGEPAIPFVGAGDLIERNGRPKWRASMRLALQRDSMDYGILANYVGKIIDTSTLQDQTKAFLPVDDWATLTAFAGLRFRLFGDADATIRLSVANLLDTAPPLADEDLGFFVGLHDAAGRTWNLSLAAEL